MDVEVSHVAMGPKSISKGVASLGICRGEQQLRDDGPR